MRRPACTRRWSAAVGIILVVVTSTRPAVGAAQPASAPLTDASASATIESAPVAPLEPAPGPAVESTAIVVTSGESPAATTAPETTVRVHVEAARVGLRFFLMSTRYSADPHIPEALRVRVREYHLVCVAPCDADVPTGRRAVALASTGGPPHPAGDIDLDHDVGIRIDLEDRRDWRTVGLLMVLISGVPGLFVLGAGIIDAAMGRGPDGVVLGIGSAMTTIGVAGIPLLSWGDTREIEIVEPPPE